MSGFMPNLDPTVFREQVNALRGLDADDRARAIRIADELASDAERGEFYQGLLEYATDLQADQEATTKCLQAWKESVSALEQSARAFVRSQDEDADRAKSAMQLDDLFSPPAAV